jgi:ferrochelatase
MDIFNKQVTAVQKLLITRVRGPVQIELAMRYGNPSIKAGLEKLRQNNAQRVLIFPLYPQYSSATTGSTFDAVADVLKSWRWVPELRMLNHYHDFAGYTEALAGRIQEHWELNGRGDKLLFSFHGLPEKYSKAGDPYCNQCHETARLVAGKLELVDAQWQVSFQSRFGPREWLKPYTDQTLMAWGQQGIKSVDVICPGFAADCLETLEEVRMLNRENFLHAGGERYSYIPALNDHPAHIGVLVELIIKNCQDWPEFSRE